MGPLNTAMAVCGATYEDYIALYSLGPTSFKTIFPKRTILNTGRTRRASPDKEPGQRLRIARGSCEFLTKFEVLFEQHSRAEQKVRAQFRKFRLRFNIKSN